MIEYPIYNRPARFAVVLADRLLGIFLRPKHPKVKKPRSLLLCNTADLGDVILTTALIAPLRAAYPELAIGMLVKGSSAHVVAGHGELAAVHTLESPVPRQYDVAIACNFHFPNSAHRLWWARIPTRIGFTSAGLSPLLTHAFDWKERAVSAAEAFLTLLAPFGIAHCPLAPTLPKPLPSPHPGCLVMHMGARAENKLWPRAKWRALAERLSADGHQLVFTGKGEKERAECAQVSAGLGLNLCDTLSWQAFTGLIAEAHTLVTVDTAAGHVAAAFGTPAVILSTGIHPPKLWKPLSNNALPIVKAMPCSPCLTGCAQMSCLREIEPESVYSLIRPRPTRPAESSSAK